jgi:hypothetical protein
MSAEQTDPTLAELLDNLYQDFPLAIEYIKDEKILTDGSSGQRRAQRTVRDIRDSTGIIVQDMASITPAYPKIIADIFTQAFAESSLPIEDLPEVAPRVLPVGIPYNLEDLTPAIQALRSKQY